MSTIEQERLISAKSTEGRTGKEDGARFMQFRRWTGPRLLRAPCRWRRRWGRLEAGDWSQSVPNPNPRAKAPSEGDGWLQTTRRPGQGGTPRRRSTSADPKVGPQGRGVWSEVGARCVGVGDTKVECCSQKEWKRQPRQCESANRKSFHQCIWKGVRYIWPV